MNIKCECEDMRTSAGQRNNLKLELEGVVLDGTVDTREVLSQLDAAVVAEWLTEQGYIITQQERAA
ncbi:thioredoxin reductase [Superficieibacter electus]|uniref:Thioredoxin reductase n=1 Tax=Superficieibacter electus TaxID=2022662 RepID=A0A2P5GSX9_9ENTR|nr:thioredoxin reductase [Superficieibacter electus]POP46889.1 thioredoxin reductase [Superficieibacter electus]POP49626.1 thioredoxin reductase [Superficieibacter electus]